MAKWNKTAALATTLSSCLLKSPALLKAFALSTLTAPPIGLAYLAGILKTAGIAYQAIDAVGESIDQILPLDYCDGYAIGLTMDEIVARIDPRADIIGLSCMFSSSWPYDHRLIDRIKARFPKADIIVGGEHATACTDYILQTCPGVKASACAARARRPCLRLVHALLRQNRPVRRRGHRLSRPRWCSPNAAPQTHPRASTTSRCRTGARFQSRTTYEPRPWPRHRQYAQHALDGDARMPVPVHLLLEPADVDDAMVGAFACPRGGRDRILYEALSGQRTSTSMISPRSSRRTGSWLLRRKSCGAT